MVACGIKQSHRFIWKYTLVLTRAAKKWFFQVRFNLSNTFLQWLWGGTNSQSAIIPSISSYGRCKAYVFIFWSFCCNTCLVRYWWRVYIIELFNPAASIWLFLIKLRFCRSHIKWRHICNPFLVCMVRHHLYWCVFLP